jgi:predicted acylesterase/phospholipase RssA
MIKNLVLSACGPNIVTMLGALHELHDQNYWNIKNIESFYGASGGAIIAVFALLSDDFDMLKDYIIKRPWNTVWPIEPDSLFNIYNKMGLFDIEDFYKAFEPFFNAKNIDKNITLKEFHELTKKTIYFYIAELNNFEVFYANHLTHPNMKLVEAMYKTSCVPGIFTPIFEDDKCYLDGGLLNYFPSCDAIKDNENNTILGLCSKRINKLTKLTNKSNVIEFFTTLLFKNMDFVIDTLFYNNEKLDHFISVPGFDNNNLWIEILETENKREEMYNLGIKTAQKFIRERLKKEEERADEDERLDEDKRADEDERLDEEEKKEN